MLKSELFDYLVTSTTFTEAREEAGEILSLARLVPGATAPWPPEEFRVFERLFFFCFMSCTVYLMGSVMESKPSYSLSEQKQKRNLKQRQSFKEGLGH